MRQENQAQGKMLHRVKNEVYRLHLQVFFPAETDRPLFVKKRPAGFEVPDVVYLYALMRGQHMRKRPGRKRRHFKDMRPEPRLNLIVGPKALKRKGTKLFPIRCELRLLHVAERLQQPVGIHVQVIERARRKGDGGLQRIGIFTGESLHGYIEFLGVQQRRNRGDSGQKIIALPLHKIEPVSKKHHSFIQAAVISSKLLRPQEGNFRTARKGILRNFRAVRIHNNPFDVFYAFACLDGTVE